MKKYLYKYFIILLICILAAAVNFLLNTLSVYYIKIPLFLDTLFNAVVCFAAGLVPGIITALFSYITLCIRNGSFDPFIICAVVEVLLIWRLKPSVHSRGARLKEQQKGILPENAVTAFVGIFARLMLLYIICCITISILGGLIDYFFYDLMSNTKQYFSAEDTFKIGFLRSGIHTLVINILSRIPVNLVDRFIVIFGGYFISRLISRLIPTTSGNNTKNYCRN